MKAEYVRKPDDVQRVEGLTKREYFAGLALQGLLGYGNESSHFATESAAIEAVKAADALLAALATPKEGDE